MKVDIIFLNILKFRDKVTDKAKYRVEYLLNDGKAMQDTATMKGVNSVAFYTDKEVLWEKLNAKDRLEPMTLVINQVPSKNNPLKIVPVIAQVVTKNGTIDLL